MEKILHQDFDTRIVIKDKVFLLASDCAEALGYNNKEDFLSTNPKLLKRVEGLPELVAEVDFNKLLVKNPDAFNVQRHIEMTKVTTLNAEISAIVNMYGLKMALVGHYFAAKAKEKNCESIEEYIERYDYPEEAQKALREFKNKDNENKSYDEEVSYLKNERIFVPEVMKKYGMTLQYFTVMEQDKLRLYAFLAGDGFFYMITLCGDYYENYIGLDGNPVDSEEEAENIEVYLGDELYPKMSVNESGELCIPLYDEETGCSEENVVGRTSENRDFRKHTVFENVVWALQNSEADREFVDSAAFTAPGIRMYLDDSVIFDIILQNNPESILIDGIIEYDVKTKITNIRSLPVFCYE